MSICLFVRHGTNRLTLIVLERWPLIYSLVPLHVGENVHTINVLWLVPVGLSKANLVDLAMTTCYLDFMHR
jgi:hypothetical protein